MFAANKFISELYIMDKEAQKKKRKSLKGLGVLKGKLSRENLT